MYKHVYLRYKVAFLQKDCFSQHRNDSDIRQKRQEAAPDRICLKTGWCN